MNKGAVIAGIIGVGAVGLGVYALTRNSQPQQQNNTDSAFNGFVGGGSTGGTTGANSAVGLVDSLTNAMNNMWSSAQNEVKSVDEIIPLMDSMTNPSDEVADVKQVSYVGNPVTYVGSNLAQVMSTLGTTSTPKSANLLTGVTKDQNTSQKTTAAEYNQGSSFGPTPKQADMSSYNEQKTGGTTENTPKQTSEKKDSTGDNRYAGYEFIGGIVNSVGDAVGGFTGWW